MKFLRRALLIATAASLLSAFGFAQSKADQQFMSEAAQDGMAKINMAYLALRNAQNEQVKAYARQILSDYGQAQNDLIYVANQHGVLLPKKLDPKDAETLDALSQLRGAAFDKAYMQAMVSESRQSSVSSLQQHATEIDNPAISKWANNALPTLQSDVKQAEKVAPVVGVHPKKTSEEAAKNDQQPAPNAGNSSDSAQQKTEEQPSQSATESSNPAPDTSEQQAAPKGNESNNSPSMKQY